jgi:nucleoside-diphosphate-sugar epimerase
VKAKNMEKVLVTGGAGFIGSYRRAKEILGWKPTTSLEEERCIRRK